MKGPETKTGEQENSFERERQQQEIKFECMYEEFKKTKAVKKV